MKKIITFIFALTLLTSNSLQILLFGQLKFNQQEWKNKWKWLNHLRPKLVLKLK